MTSISVAQTIFQRERKRGFDALNEIFRAGSPPNPLLEGDYKGQLVALDVAPGLNQFIEMITSRWMPWKGKSFDAARASGINSFTRDSLLLAQVFWPLYRDYKDESVERYRAFTFRTSLAPGLTDPDRQVLKMDYNITGNPSLQSVACWMNLFRWMLLCIWGKLISTGGGANGNWSHISHFRKIS